MDHKRFIPTDSLSLPYSVAVLAVLVLLIGFSRIYLGAHYLSDVIAGYAAAAVWLTFCILVTDRTQRR